MLNVKFIENPWTAVLYFGDLIESKYVYFSLGQYDLSCEVWCRLKKRKFDPKRAGPSAWEFGTSILELPLDLLESGILGYVS